MALNRDKFRRIVGGITTPEEAPEPKAAKPAAPVAGAEKASPAAVQEREPADEARAGESRRFAKRGRPKGRKDDAAPTGKARKVKVSLFLSEFLVNDLYDWAHADKVHPGEMFERALMPFHEKEAKRRNGGKE